MIITINVLVYVPFGLLFARPMRVSKITIIAEGKNEEAVTQKCCLTKFTYKCTESPSPGYLARQDLQQNK